MRRAQLFSGFKPDTVPIPPTSLAAGAPMRVTTTLRMEDANFPVPPGERHRSLTGARARTTWPNAALLLNPAGSRVTLTVQDRRTRRNCVYDLRADLDRIQGSDEVIVQKPPARRVYFEHSFVTWRARFAGTTPTDRSDATRRGRRSRSNARRDSWRPPVSPVRYTSRPPLVP